MWPGGYVIWWLCGLVALWICISVALRLCGSEALWLCCPVALWLCGSVALCLCGSSPLRLCGSSALRLCGSATLGPDSRTICEFATFYVTLRYEFQSCEFHICEYSQIGIFKQLAKNRSYEFRNCFSQLFSL